MKKQKNKSEQPPHIQSPQLSEKDKTDILYKEFLFEHSRADVYIERNYKVLTVWAAALTALLTVGTKKELVDTDLTMLTVFGVVLPAINLVCAIFYAFNSYANMLCGYRAEVIHRVLFSDSLVNLYDVSEIEKESIKTDFKDKLPRYILSNALLSAPTYIALVLVFICSSAFGYIYAYNNCMGPYPDYVAVSMAIFIALAGALLLLYLCVLLPNATSRKEVKKEKKRDKKSKKKRVYLVMLIILFIYLVYVSIFNIVIYCSSANRRNEFQKLKNETIDYIVVLGNKLNDDKPSDVLNERLEAANYLAEKYASASIIVSGGITSGNSISEAEVMKAYLIKKGISSNRIISEEKSKTTLENMKYIEELINNDSTVIIVTNSFHINRAIMIAKKHDIGKVYGYPVPNGSLSTTISSFFLEPILYLANLFV